MPTLSHLTPQVLARDRDLQVWQRLVSITAEINVSEQFFTAGELRLSMVGAAISNESKNVSAKHVYREKGNAQENCREWAHSVVGERGVSDEL